MGIDEYNRLHTFIYTIYTWNKNILILSMIMHLIMHLHGQFFMCGVIYSAMMCNNHLMTNQSFSMKCVTTLIQ